MRKFMRDLFGNITHNALLCICNQQRYKDSIIVIHTK